MFSASSKKIYIILSLLLVILLVGVGVLWVMQRLTPSDPLAEMVIPPDKPRSWAEEHWENAVNPKPSGDPLQSRYLDSNVSWEITDTSPNEKKISFKMRRAPDEYEPAREIVHLQAPDYSWQDGERQVRLLWVGIGQITDTDTSPPIVYHYTYRYFKPSGQEVPVEELPEAVANRTRYDATVHHRAENVPGNQVHLVLETEGFVENKRRIGAMFDQGTHAQVVESWSYGMSGGLLQVTALKQVVHAAPTLFSLDLVSGEPVIYEFDPRQTDQLETPHFRLLSHGGHPGMISGHISTRLTDQAGVTTYSGDFAFDESPHEGFFGFSLSPAATSLQMQMELVGKNGATGSSSVSRDSVVRWRKPLEDLEKARLKYYPDVTRVIVHIPVLPAEEANHGLTNMLDAEMPVIRIEHPDAWRTLLGKMTMLKTRFIMVSSHAVHPSPYPLEFRDITVRELLYQYLEHHPGQEIIYNPIDDTLTFAPIDDSTPWKKTVQWFQEQLP